MRSASLALQSLGVAAIAAGIDSRLALDPVSSIRHFILPGHQAGTSLKARKGLCRGARHCVEGGSLLASSGTVHASTNEESSRKAPLRESFSEEQQQLRLWGGKCSTDCGAADSFLTAKRPPSHVSFTLG